jgi:lactoylglutathione lyase
MILTPYLIVKDMEKSCEFYTAFFQEQPDRHCPGRFVVFNAGNTKLSLYNPEYDRELIESGADLSKHFNRTYLENQNIPVRYGNNVIINIGVSDLANEYERIKSLNIGEVSDIFYVNIAAPYWGFWLIDPDGNCIEITGAYTPKERASPRGCSRTRICSHPPL